MTKKAWKDWAIDFIKSTNRCPGENPSFGSPNDMMTEEQFKQSIASGGSHKFDGCHFLDVMLGGEIGKDIKPVEVNDDKVNEGVAALSKDIGEVEDAKTIALIKSNLHSYVERIELKKGRTLFVPEPLLKIKDYLAKFFTF